MKPNPISRLSIMSFKSALLVILLIPALAISYYFVVALPSNEHLRLQFEKEKYETEKRANTEQEQKRKDNEIQLGLCALHADNEYQTSIKLNGKKVSGKQGILVPTYIVEQAEKRRNDALAECHKRFDR